MSSFSIKGGFSPNIFSRTLRAFADAAEANLKRCEMRLMRAASLAFSVMTEGKWAEVSRLKKSLSFIDSISQAMPLSGSFSAKAEAMGVLSTERRAGSPCATPRVRAGELKNFSAMADAASGTGGTPVSGFPRRSDERYSGARFGRRIPPSKSLDTPVPLSRIVCKIL